MQIVLRGVLAISAVSFVIGCVVWIKGLGRQLALANVPTILLVSSMLLDDGHSALRYTLLAAAVALSSYSLISARHRIRWRSPMMVCGATSILLIIVIEVVPGIPRAGVRVLLYAFGASTILFVGSMLWEMGHAFARPNNKLQPTSGGIKVE